MQKYVFLELNLMGNGALLDIMYREIMPYKIWLVSYGL